MPTIAEAFDVAWKHHQAGELAQAEQIYRQILQVQPKNAQAMHLLGLIALQVNMQDAAIEQFQQAIEANPSNATYHGSLGTVYLEAGRYEEAAECLRRAIKYDPGYHDAYLNLGKTLIELGEPEEALDCFHEALDIMPDSSEAYNFMGNALQQLGEIEDAAVEYRQAIYHKPDYAQAHYNLAVALSKLGRHEQAVSHYLKAAELKPTHPTFHNLAIDLARLGRHSEAFASFQQSLSLKPDSPETLAALGDLLAELGQVQGAADSYRRALQFKPYFVEAEIGLGFALLGLGQPEDALAHYQAALRIHPDSPAAKLGLADVLMAQGKLAEATDAYRKLIAEHPELAAGHLNLGIALARQGRLDEAVAAYAKALEVQPKLAEACHNMGVARSRQGRLAEAAECYRRAVGIEADHVPALTGLGGALASLGQIDEGIVELRRAIELSPDYAPAYNSLGTALVRQCQYAQAEEAFAKAIQILPNYVDPICNRAAAFKEQGRLDESLKDLREALRIEPRHFGVQSNLLVTMHYSPDCKPEDILLQARAYGAMLAERVRPLPPPSNPRQPDRPLRVGCVSGDFREHPLGYFFEAFAREHDPRAYALFCYANQGVSDELTERVRRAAQAWRPIGGLADDQVARTIREDGIDVLLDLSGHRAGGRLPLFAWKAAPVQALWLGSFGTTGVQTIDYAIGDRFVTPADEEIHFVEQILRLPHSFLCFTPPSLILDVSKLPSLAGQGITFGSFSSLAKVTADVVRTWAEVLRAVPSSKLLLKDRALVDERTRNRLFAQFADAAVGPSRLRFEGASSRGELLKAYHQVDIALDPFPFNGAATTAEALWMGVPVVTLSGTRFASHVGESILSAAGLDDLVSHGEQAYVARAADLAGNLAGLTKLRANLRGHILGSPLCDGRAFAREMESLLRRVWQAWCQRP